MQKQAGGVVASRVRAGMFCAVLFALIAWSGCNSRNRSSERTAESSALAETHPTSKPAGADPRINLNCLLEHLQNPPDSFAYVYRKDASDGFGVDQEATITPEAIDGFRKQPDGSQQAIHATRSDPQSWQTALAGLTGISGMSGTVATFNNTSALRRESDGGTVNGYETIHYSIDTSRWDATEWNMLGNFALGPGGFDKGDAWVTSQGCPVKLVLDDEMHKKDGGLLGKEHYEVSMSKK